MTAFVTNGCIACYDFNEASGTILDKTLNGYNGTQYNGAQNQAALYNKGILLAGVSHQVNFPGLVVPAIGSVALWIRPKGTITDGSTWTLFSQHRSVDAANSRFEYGVIQISGTKYHHWRSGPTAAKLAVLPALVVDTDYLFGVSWNNTTGTLKFFQGAAQVGPTLTGLVLGTDTAGFTNMGCRNSGATAADGSLPGNFLHDHLALYSQELSAQEWTTLAAWDGSPISFTPSRSLLGVGN